MYYVFSSPKNHSLGEFSGKKYRFCKYFSKVKITESIKLKKINKKVIGCTVVDRQRNCKQYNKRDIGTALYSSTIYSTSILIVYRDINNGWK